MAAPGAALVDRVDMIMFTGSTAIGRRVAAQAGERLIPCWLELGGKDPMIVCADADLDRAAGGAVQWAWAARARCACRWSASMLRRRYEPFLCSPSGSHSCARAHRASAARPTSAR